jgi:D-tyrosyl-tRNA(Tyr) deacylase
VNKFADVFFFCNDPDRDPCAPMVFHELQKLHGIAEAGFGFDGFPVLAAERQDGSEGLFVRTQDVVSNDYARYGDLLANQFGDLGSAVVVNWHEGANAPDRVLTFHSTGDVVSGVYGPTTPSLFSAYVRALERERVRGELSSYRTVVEGTHWSGVMYGAQPEQIRNYQVPIYDMEIGSSKECWTDPEACTALARVCRFGPELATTGSAIIYCGGTHFEENVTAAALSGRWHIGHVLPNQWLVAGDYDSVGGGKLERCAASHTESVSRIVMHKGLASRFRNACLEFAKASGIAAMSHRQLRVE